MAQQINESQIVGGNYSTSEVDTGAKWVDGKTIFRKTISLGSLPDSTNKTVAHGITGIGTVVALTGIANASGLAVPMPYGNPSLSSSVSLYLDGANLGIGTGANRTGYIGYATIEYTKA